MPPPGRRKPPALLIFIRGRWQSVPPGCGFAVIRRGRLEELRSGTVRDALRRFQMWLPSKARLGPRLSFKKNLPSAVENSDNEALIDLKQITRQNGGVRPGRRVRDTTSCEEPNKSVTTVATVHATKQPKTSKNHQLHTIRLFSSESTTSVKSRTDLRKQMSKEIIVKSPKKLTGIELKNQKCKEIMESPKKSSVSSRNLLDSPKRSLSLRRKPVEQTNLNKQSSPILKSTDLSEKQISRYLQRKTAKQNKNPRKGEEVLSDSDFETDQSEILKSKIKLNHSPKKINSISNPEFGTKNEKQTSNHRTQNKFHKIGPKRQKLDQDTLETPSSKTAENIFQRPNETHQTQSQTIGTCKELEIDERDIELLRIFLQNHYSDKVLLKFDADDEYKRMIFFRINPLVNIEWCPVIDRMLRRSQDSQITLTDFASNLGLRSVTEAAPNKNERYKIRKRTDKSCADSDSDASSEDKDNNYKTSKIEKTKILKEREHNMRGYTGDDKAKESKNKLSNKRSRKRAESDSEMINTKENITKAGIAKERTTRANNNTVESESGENAKENNIKAGREKKKTTRTIHNTVKSDSENNSNVEKTKERGKTENGNKAKNYYETSDAKENNIKVRIAKERKTKANQSTVESDSEASKTKNQTQSEVHNKVDTGSKVSNSIKHNIKDSNAEKTTKTEQRNSGDSDSRKSNPKTEDRNRKEIDITVELSSESETGQAVKAIKKTVKPKPVISSKRRRTNLEYSNLEDHAIVAWVSSGSRASRVNGNLLWRQLQDQYAQITGTRRTWHSLRNRYLRYILPKLGGLALPLSQQTRLRAAAATGELKAKKARSPRRNSIFKLPPRGAASRRPAATNNETETENKVSEVPSKRSPRYSSLTRRFTRRQNMTRPSSELSDDSQRSDKPDVKDRKTSEVTGNFQKKSHGVTVNKPPLKQTNGKANSGEHSDSDERGESTRRDNASSDSSSELDDESERSNEPRRTRRSVNESNKLMATSGTRQNTNESKRRLTRQLKILDESDQSKRRKSRGETDKHKPAREKTNESSKRNLNRHISPGEQTSTDSNESRSQPRRESPEKNRRRSRRHTKQRDESDAASNESNRRKSPIMSISRSSTRKSNRHYSSSKQSLKGSNTSMSQVRRKSKSPIKSENTRHESSSEESDSSRGSVIQRRRRSNRINSSKDRSNRRKSNRLMSTTQNGRLSSDSPTRKSNRLTPNETSNKRRHSSESKRKSKLAKRDSLDEIVTSDSSESFETKKAKIVFKKKVDPPKKRVDKQKMRRLFNPKSLL